MSKKACRQLAALIKQSIAPCGVAPCRVSVDEVGHGYWFFIRIAVDFHYGNHFRWKRDIYPQWTRKRRLILDACLILHDLRERLIVMYGRDIADRTVSPLVTMWCESEIEHEKKVREYLQSQ